MPTRRRDEIELARDIASDARGVIERTGKGGAALLDNDTYWRFRESFSAWQCGNTSTGQFWQLWTQTLDGTFEPTELAHQQGIAHQQPGQPAN